MTMRLNLMRRGLAYVVCMGVMLAATGCFPDWGGLEPGGFWIFCDVPVWDCPKTVTPPSFTLSGPHASVSKYITRNSFWKDKNAVYQVYWHPQIFAVNPGPKELLGSTMIMTGGADWNVTDAAFMTIKLQEDVAGIYVAYDSRANPKPSWLKDSAKYEKLTGSLRITMPDHTKSPPEHLRLDVYRVKGATANGATVVLPGNNHGGPGWPQPNVSKGNPAMYVVFVQPKAKVPANCGSGAGTYKTTVHVDDCQSYNADEETPALAAAKNAATAVCQAAHPDNVCLTPACTNAGWVPTCDPTKWAVPSARYLNADGAFEHNSEVEFSAASSSASGTVSDSSFNSPISGTLLFEYQGNALAAMDVMQVNRMGLDVASFETEVGNFTEIKVALLDPTVAECQDSPAPVATPCEHYQIPAGQFQCLESCRIDGDPVAFTSYSDDVIDIHLDPVTYKFTFTGSVRGTATVDGDNYDINVTLTLVGQVVNYAPSAAAGFEGDDFAECSDETNESAIYLNAGKSFDVDDGALPGSSFEWYEDYGLVTQYHWGTGETVTIGAGQLGFGEHNVTLVVTDSQGVLDTDTIVVRVADTTPPDLDEPDDVEIFTAAPLPTLVQLGEAYASDKCLPLPEKAITNDAPADSRFGAGETTVTWSAEDGTGNVATDTQRVLVNSVGVPGSLIDAIRQGIIHLQEAIDQSQADVSQCKPAEECPVDLGALVVMIDELIGTTHEAAEQDDEGAERYAALLESLEMVRMHLLEATEALEESNAAGEPDPALMMREQALDNLMAARALLDDSAHQVEMLEGDAGPTDGDEPIDEAPDDDSPGPEEQPGDDGESAADQDGQPSGGGSVRRSGLCGLGVVLLLACLPVLAIWKVGRRLL